ncbi:hypothetical protein PVAP13_9NG571514 [Panicum virgatum]|uniref:Uncharacterized protein n=1 Tax=Panicum virgatum TaxID=38727 RepID=A0A8T0N557_PANVG|nr:hypothetical protein PVAP13_9NG571514 [Panicum virgatum]KAG2542176.1 hypothetical protein PVAP13_9NG571514 [Panicum virgatum]KAG2542177.1 hypothetical protein PVAP13_9NG571514 [Panicum virgatum]
MHAKSLPRPPPSRYPSPTNLVASTSTPSPLNPCNRNRCRIILFRAGGSPTPPSPSRPPPPSRQPPDSIHAGSSGSGWSIGKQAGANGITEGRLSSYRCCSWILVLRS